MLESVIAPLVNRFLNAYVDNLDNKQLNVGLWGGDIKLTNLKLKREALDKFRLPVDVIEGYLESLTLSIPWLDLKGKPVKVSIDNIYLLAVPAADQKYDAEDDARRKQAYKMERLENAELLTSKPSAGFSQDDDLKNQSFAASLVSRIVDNLQISVRNVHLRYEDKLSMPGHPFAVGLTLGGFTAQSTDEFWQPTFLVNNADGVHKLAKLESLALYFDTDAPSIAGLPLNEAKAKFAELICTDTRDAPHQFILKPVSGDGHLILRNHFSKEQAKMDAELLFRELGFVLDSDQYRDALSMVDLFHFTTRQHQYRPLKPPDSEFVDNRPRALLKFALTAIRHEVHEKHKVWTWDHFKQRRDDRRDYLAHFKILAKDQDAVESKQKVAALEQKLSYRDLRFYRSIARSEMRKERITAQRATEEQRRLNPEAANANTQSVNRGWVGWLWGRSSAKTQEDQPQDLLSDEQRKELYETIDWDEKQSVATSVDLPRDILKMHVTAKLDKGSFILRQEPHGKQVDMISISFDNFSADIVQRPDNLEAAMSLGSMAVFDRTRPNSKHSQVVSVKVDETCQQKAIENKEGETELDAALAPKPKELNEQSTVDEQSSFFYVKFEQNPLDERADTGLTVRLRYMEIFYHRGYIEEIFRFFKPPASQLESVSALVDVASETLEGLRKETRAGLEFALQNHKTVDLKVDMNAPVIIIPEDVTRDDSLHLIIDAGHISVESNLADKSTLKEIRDKQNQQYSEKDWKRLEGLMYDKFHVKLESTQVLLGPSLEACQRAMSQQTADSVHLLERINMIWLAEHAIVSQIPTLPQFKVSGRLPELAINISDRKYKSLMRMLDVAIPHFDDDSTNNAGTTPTTTSIDAGPAPTNVRDRRKSLNMKAQFDNEEHEIGDLDQDTDIEDNESDGDKEDKFYEAPDVVDSQTAALAQEKFRLSFAVDRFTTSIYKASAKPKEADLLLAVATFAGFEVGVSSRPYDMSVTVALHSLSVLDKMIDESSKFKQIIAVSDDEEERDESTAQSLIAVQYNRCDPSSPQFMTKFESFNQSVDVQMSKFNITVTRASILMLFDWVLATFTDNTAVPPQAPVQQQSDDGQPQAVEAPQQAQNGEQAQKLRVRVKMSGFELILNDDGVRLGTLLLSAADVSIFLRSPTMRVSARLGNLTLTDDSHAHSNDHPDFRHILSIKGDEVADLQYETYDSSEQATYPGYDTLFRLRTGSLQFTFLEGPVHQMLRFLTQFARMKAVLDAARAAAAQQATDLVERAPRMHFDIVVNTPIALFPRHSKSSDLIVAHLGEIQASNRFDGSLNRIQAGLHSIRLTSRVYGAAQSDAKSDLSELQILSDANFKADVTLSDGSMPSADGTRRPGTAVDANLSDIKVHLTADQYSFLMALSRSVAGAFGTTDEEKRADLQAEKRLNQSSGIPLATPKPGQTATSSQAQTDLLPEISRVQRTPDGNVIELDTSMELHFGVKAISLDLYNDSAKTQDQLKSAGIAHFSINRTRVTAKMLSDGSMEAELLVRNFVITDMNTKKGTKYREIIPATRHKDSHQLMLSYSMSGGELERSAIANLTIDTPTVMFSLDPLFSILNFITGPFSAASPASAQTASGPAGNSPNQQSADATAVQSTFSLAYRVNVVSAKIMLLADPQRVDSEAIQMSVEQVLLAQQGTLVLSASKLGMFLCHMNRQDDRIRVLDDLDITLSHDNRADGGQQISNIELDLQAIVLRASYRDLALVQAIVLRAIELSNKSSQPAENNGSADKSDSERLRKSDSAVAIADMDTPESSQSPQENTAPSTVATRSKQPTVVLAKESLKATFDGFQLILIDLQELPLVVLRTEKFMVLASDWSRDLRARVTMQPLVNFFNLSTSHWEPLMDPWEFTASVSRNVKDSSTAVNIAAKKRLELNVAANFIEQAYTTYNLWLSEGEQILRRDRGARAPFLIRNRTGYTALLWSEVDGSGSSKEPAKDPVKLETGKDMPWRFDDWKAMREHILSVSHNALSVAFEDTMWERLKHISVDREGEHIYALRPKLDKVTHRLLCEIKLVDNIKVVTLRSTFNVENLTLIPTELVVVDADGHKASSVFKIAPGGSCPVPIEAAYHQRIRIRPDVGFGYGWSTRAYHWQDLVKRRRTTIACQPQEENGGRFLFQTYAVCDLNDPLLRAYPRLTLRLRPPIEVENLLPYDIKFRIYDKATKHNYSSFLRKGGTSPIHLADLAHLILLSVEVQHNQFQRSEFAIVNTDNPDDLPIENELTVADNDGLVLKLRINYVRYPDSGEAFKIQVYSPFIFINKTGCDFALKYKPRFGPAKNAAGQSIFAKDSARQEPHPFLFAYPSDDHKNRALLRINDSEWSEPLSFEAVGTATEVKLARAHSTGIDYMIGLRIAEGVGIYKLTRVVTIYPRYLVKNYLNETIRLRQHDSANILELKSGEREAFLEMQTGPDPLLAIGMLSSNNWSVPFELQQVGTNYLRYKKSGQEQLLLRVDVALEGAVIHIQVHHEAKSWPFTIHNTSSVDLQFHQTPLEENADDLERTTYKIRSGARLDYAWDHLVGAKRSITLYAGDSTRIVDLLKIGQEQPFVFKTGDKRKVLSIDISAESSTQNVLFADYKEEKNMFKLHRRPAPMSRQSTLSSFQDLDFEVVQSDQTGKMDFCVTIEGIGVSLINRKMQELAYMSFRGLEVRYTDSQVSQAFNVECKWIQIDNQLFGGVFPIILFPSEIPKDGKDLEAHPNFSLSALMLKDHAHGVIHFQFVNVLLQQMTIEIDEDFIFALVDFAQLGGAFGPIAESKLIDEDAGIPEPDLVASQTELFFELFTLQPIQLDVSFMRTENMNSDQTTFLDNRNPAAYLLNALTMALGNVNDAPIRFNYLGLENARMPMSVLYERIFLHYSQAFYGQLYRILGSADFLGNPIGLFQNVSSGVADIFFAPYEGFVLHGGDVGYALAKGAGSFVKKTVFGFSDSFAKVTGSIGKGLSAATLDKEFQSRRRMRRSRNKPQHALYGVTTGASSFFTSVASGVEGLARKPLEGAEADGAAGFIKGFGKGLVGAVTKPAVGFFDLANGITEGIRNTTTVFEPSAIDRVRLPRHIASDGVLRPYQEREALGQSWLKALDNGQYFKERYVAHLSMQPAEKEESDLVVILTESRILLVRTLKLKVQWDIALADLKTISLEPKGIALKTRSGRHGPFFAIPDKSSRLWLFQHLEKVVRAYNHTK